MIATPLKLVHYLHEGVLSLARVERLVLDEADRLFDLGFVQQMDEIIAACTFPGIQRSLFSATLPDGVEEMARSFLVDPVRVVIGSKCALPLSVSCFSVSNLFVRPLPPSLCLTHQEQGDGDHRAAAQVRGAGRGQIAGHAANDGRGWLRFFS